jgi:Barstar (barnase inhibitor)
MSDFHSLSTPDGFTFADELPAVEGTIVMRVPPKINRKRQLMLEYVRRLGFPRYFGWNWDAFYDCLCDLSWLEGVKRVILAHEDVPFKEGSEQREAYLRMLADAVQTLKRPPAVELVVSFPSGHQLEVAQSLAEPS